MLLRPDIGNSCVVCPTYDTTSVLPLAGTLMVYSPSALVVVPTLVPFTKMFAPWIGAPLASVIFPETVRPCAKAAGVPATIKRTRTNTTFSFFIIVYLVR